MLRLTVDTGDGEDDVRGAGAGVNVDLEADGGVELVDVVVAERLPRLQALARLLPPVLVVVVRERDRVERSVRLRRERRDDAERRTRARRRPEQVRVLRLGRGADRAVRGHDLERRDLVGEEAPRTRGQAEATLASVTADADVGAGTVSKCALACQGARAVRLHGR